MFEVGVVFSRITFRWGALDSTHDLASNKLLKLGDIDNRLLLSALFDSPRSIDPIDLRFLVPLRNLPSSIVQCIRTMQQAKEESTLVNTQGIFLDIVDEVALHHILVDIFFQFYHLPQGHRVFKNTRLHYINDTQLRVITRIISC